MISEGGRDTSTCQISGHSFHAISRECMETPNLASLKKLKLCQNDKNQQTVSKI